MKIRKYEKNKDFNQVYRIWREISWIKDSEKEKKALQYFTEAGEGTVSLLNGEVEGYLNSTPGKYQYLNKELNLQAVTAVTISRVARKQGLASFVTAESIAKAAQQGADISALGMFEQGFYNKLGYGTGNYEHFISFDPDHLNIKGKAPVPKRITVDDWKKVHQARLNQVKRHGNCTLSPEKLIHAEMLFPNKDCFGLGYKDSNNNITHHVWFKPDNNEHGPYFIKWLNFNNQEQFFDLLRIIKSLGDQIHLIRTLEPAGIQFQNLIKKPYKDRTVTKNGNFEVNNNAIAYWQVRILNLKNCIENTSINNENVEFNLKLKDPIEKYLDNKYSWKGLSGNYNLSIGKSSKIEKGFKDNLPILDTDINTFSRMWVGAVRPQLLSYTNHFEAPKSLINKLDNLFVKIPNPRIDWLF